MSGLKFRAPLVHWIRSEQGAYLVRLLFAIAVVQLVFWVAVKPVLFVRGHPDHVEYAMRDFEAARIATPDAAGLAAAKFEAIDGPGWYGCCEPGYWAVRFKLDIPAVPDEGLGVITQVNVDNIAVRINGQLAIQHGEIDLARLTYHGNERQIDFVPPGAVRAGENVVEYILTRSAMPYSDLGAPVFGPRSEVERAFGGQAFLLGPMQDISILIGYVLTGFALLLLIQSEAKTFPFALFLLLLSWTLKAHFYQWSEPPFGGMVRLYFYFLVTGALPIAWLHFADRWTERPLGWVPWVCLAGLGALAATFAWALWALPAGAGFDFASEVANWSGVAFIGLTLTRFAWHVLRHRDTRHWEVAIFCLLCTLAVAEFLTEVIWKEAAGYFSRTTPFLILALVIAVFSRSIRLFRSADQINQILTDRLKVREGELMAAHVREREFVRRQAHDEERQRILRDMHDGLGSQLMSMLLAARRGHAPPEQVADGLQTVVDEMRLIIASMDSVGESLFAALSLFRDRMSQRIAAAGVRLDWRNDYGPDFPRYGPRATLQVFRILQEAVANALKHSGGDVISVAIESQPGFAGGVRLVVADAGKSNAGPPQPGSGRGLANMRARAESIGATLSIAAGPAGGVEVILDLPAPADEQTSSSQANAAVKEG